MRRKHVVKSGECSSSVAFHHGVPSTSLWEHSANSEVRTARRDPHVLRPGDVLEIPDRPRRDLVLTRGQTNRYRATIPTLTLRLRIARADGPRRGEAFTLEIGGRSGSRGTTDGDGIAALQIPANAVEGLLIVGGADDETRLRLDFGHLNPVDDVTGAQQRLNNLGYSCGPIDGLVGPRTSASLRAFQAQHHLVETGALDEATRAELLRRHGS